MSCLADGTHYRDDAIHILAVGHAGVDHRIGKAHAHVGDGRDGVVWNEVHVARIIAQAQVAQGQFLDHAGLAACLDHVAVPNSGRCAPGFFAQALENPTPSLYY